MRETIYNILSKNEDLNNKGCVLLDAAVYFPYANQEDVTFDVALVEDICEEPVLDSIFGSDIKYNHRYPNHGYSTVSKKYGRKVCPIGYPVVNDIEKLNEMEYLACRFGIKGQYLIFFIPISIKLSEDKPYTYIQVWVNAKELTKDSIFISIDTHDSGSIKEGWRRKHYSTNPEAKDAIPLEPSLYPLGKLSMLYVTPVVSNSLSWEDAVRPV